MNSITIRSYCVRSMLIEKCSGDLSSGFETLQNLDILLTDLHHQVTKVDLDATTAKHLRFTIKNGFQEFCAIYKKSQASVHDQWGDFFPSKSIISYRFGDQHDFDNDTTPRYICNHV
ncbi:hypothetical protein FOCC_FOCC009109 [Frankliniella occidentalis]|nr:hypothetical protein FOCC_FOCC009109 [Frankliniella occidentalis]